MVKSYPDKFYAKQKVQVEQDSTYEDANDENNQTKTERDGTLLVKNKPTIFHTQTKIRVDGKDTYKDTPDKMRLTKIYIHASLVQGTSKFTYRTKEELEYVSEHTIWFL